jgi:hypothetical protein
MEALVEIMEAERLVPIFNIPAAMRNEQVQVIVLPVRNGKAETEKPAATLEPDSESSLYAPGDTVAERIRKFREKYNRETFVEHLKKKLAEGVVFEFDAQKIIDGTETEEERQERYRMEKRAWSDDVAERIKRGEL